MTSLSTQARAARLGRTRKRGVTLIEAVLYISIALALIVGGLVFFQQASLAQRTNGAVRNISAIASEVRALWSQENTFNGVTDVALIRAGAVPSSLVDSSVTPNVLRNEWAAVIGIAASPVQGSLAAGTGFTVRYNNVPEAACVRLTSADVTGSGRVGSGIRSVAFGAGGTASSPPGTPVLVANTATTPPSANLTPSLVAGLCRTAAGSGTTVDIEFTFNR